MLFKRICYFSRRMMMFAGLGYDWWSRLKLVILYVRIAIHVRRYSSGFLKKPVQVVLCLEGKRLTVTIRCRLDIDLLIGIFAKHEYRLRLDGEPGVIFDLGSNVGFSVLYFATLYSHARIFAFEPDPANLVELRRYAEPFGDRVRVIPNAVDAVGGVERIFYTSSEHHASSSFYQKGAEFSAFTVKTVSLDEIMAEHHVSTIDLLKFDIEGAEYAVFSHFKHLDRVRYLVGEIHPTLFQKTSDEFLKLFPGFEILFLHRGTKHDVVALRNMHFTA